MLLDTKIQRYLIMNHYRKAVRKGDFNTAKKLLYLLITGRCVLHTRHWTTKEILLKNGFVLRTDKYGIQHAKF